MKEVRNLNGKKVCNLLDKKIEIVYKGCKTIIDFANPDKPKVINKRR